jgi:hypothetical protein
MDPKRYLTLLKKSLLNEIYLENEPPKKDTHLLRPLIDPARICLNPVTMAKSGI